MVWITARFQRCSNLHWERKNPSRLRCRAENRAEIEFPLVCDLVCGIACAFNAPRLGISPNWRTPVSMVWEARFLHGTNNRIARKVFIENFVRVLTFPVARNVSFRTKVIKSGRSQPPHCNAGYPYTRNTSFPCRVPCGAYARPSSSRRRGSGELNQPSPPGEAFSSALL